jgi:S1-C subfamily serine protease
MDILQLRYKRAFTLLFIATLMLTAAVAVSAQDTTPTAPAPEATAEVTQADRAPRPFVGVAYEIVQNGAEITAVAQGSPAEAAGLEVGDVVTAIDGTDVDGDPAALILNYAPGNEITLTVERDGETLELSVTLGEAQQITAFPPRMRRDRDQRRQVVPVMPMMNQPFLGVTLAETENGVVVSQVVPESPAEEAGLQRDDIITALNGESVESAQQLAEQIANLEVGDEIMLSVQRGEETLDLTAVLSERASVMGMRLGQGQGPLFQLVAGEFNYLEDENIWEVGELAEDSTFYEAGLRPGDRITEIDGEAYSLENLPGLRGPMMLTGEDVTLTIERDGETQEITVPDSILPSLILSAQGIRLDFSRIIPLNPDNMIPFQMPRLQNRARLGVAYITLDAQTAAEFDLDVTQGAVLTQISPRSPAATAGLQVDDVITAVDGETLTQDFELGAAIGRYQVGDTVTLDVLREGESIQIEVTLGQPEQFSGMPQMRPGRLPLIPARPATPLVPAAPGTSL